MNPSLSNLFWGPSTEVQSLFRLLDDLGLNWYPQNGRLTLKTWKRVRTPPPCPVWVPLTQTKSVQVLSTVFTCLKGFTPVNNKFVTNETNLVCLPFPKGKHFSVKNYRLVYTGCKTTWCSRVPTVSPDSSRMVSSCLFLDKSCHDLGWKGYSVYLNCSK